MRIFAEGTFAIVELRSDEVEGGVIAECQGHQQETGMACKWTAAYDDWADATEYVADHADGGNR